MKLLKKRNILKLGICSRTFSQTIEVLRNDLDHEDALIFTSGSVFQTINSRLGHFERVIKQNRNQPPQAQVHTDKIDIKDIQTHTGQAFP